MNKLPIFIYILLITFLIACGPRPTISTFDVPFPKKNFDLTRILGSQLSIKRLTDTLSLYIIGNKVNNTIINSKTGDTIFDGKICKYRGLYYFNEELNDGLFWIYAVKIEDSLIYGFDGALEQNLNIDFEIKSGKNKSLVKFINSDTSIIRLHPEKHEMKKLFSSIINQFVPDTILFNADKTIEAIKNKSVFTEFDPEEFDNILKAYPNPTRDIINLELRQKNKSTYRLTDISGKTVSEGQLTEIANKIDISKQPEGIYALTIFNVADKQKETIKIVKMQ